MSKDVTNNVLSIYGGGRDAAARPRENDGLGPYRVVQPGGPASDAPLSPLAGNAPESEPFEGEPSPIEALVKSWYFEELKIEYDARYRMLIYRMAPKGRPCATTGLMTDIKRMQTDIRACFEQNVHDPEPPLRYLVLGSAVPGIFNLGGNLMLFAGLITDRNRKGLEDYARLSIDVIHANAMNLDLPIITASLVQGDALGGGFEAAMCSNVLIAEKRAKFGLPEILFGLFPGMGAYSFLVRRLGMSGAERMIFSGDIKTAEELRDTDIVDILAEDGEGEVALQEFARATDRRFSANSAIYRVRRRISAPSYDEMYDVARIWVDAALGMRSSEIRAMLRLAKAQERRTQRSASPVI